MLIHIRGAHIVDPAGGRDEMAISGFAAMRSSRARETA
jgi:hypothetical protein